VKAPLLAPVHFPFCDNTHKQYIIYRIRGFNDSEDLYWSLVGYSAM